MSRKEWQRTFPSMPNSKKFHLIFYQWSGLIIQVELYYFHWKEHREDAYFIEQMEDFTNRTREFRFKTMIKDQTACTNSIPTSYCLGNCPTATTAVTPIFPEKWISYGEAWNNEKQQGNNPMDTYKTNSTSAAVTISAPASDESKKSDFLLKEFNNISAWDVFAKLRKQFNIGAPKFPKSSQELLDAFAKGAFKVDQAKVDKNTKYLADTDENECNPYEDGEYIGERFYGITFTDLPVEDEKGYCAATSAYEKAKTDTRRAIVIGSPADGLAALKAFETWTYTPAAE